jgi:hypothetical protein
MRLQLQTTQPILEPCSLKPALFQGFSFWFPGGCFPTTTRRTLDERPAALRTMQTRTHLSGSQLADTRSPRSCSDAALAEERRRYIQRSADSRRRGCVHVDSVRSDERRSASATGFGAAHEAAGKGDHILKNSKDPNCQFNIVPAGRSSKPHLRPSR